MRTISTRRSSAEPTFRELFDVITPSLGTWGPGEGSSFEFDLDLRALFCHRRRCLELGRRRRRASALEIDGTLDVGASFGFVDALTKALPRFAFGVDLSRVLRIASYIRAETLLLHAEAHADNLDFGARLAFLSVGVEDGSIDLDADVEIDLTVLDADDNKKITLSEIARQYRRPRRRDQRHARRRVADRRRGRHLGWPPVTSGP